VVNDILDAFALYGAIRVGRLAWNRWLMNAKFPELHRQTVKGGERPGV
jgi:hypothetical protein